MKTQVARDEMSPIIQLRDCERVAVAFSISRYTVGGDRTGADRREVESTHLARCVSRSGTGASLPTPLAAGHSSGLVSGGGQRRRRLEWCERNG